MLLDHFLSNAIECDVDCVRDKTGAVYIGGVMEHIEQAGVHSGDSACSLPPYYLKADTVAEIKRQTAAMAAGLNVVGLMNVQFAIKEQDGQDVIYVLEVNPVLRVPCLSSPRRPACSWPRWQHAAWLATLWQSKASPRK